MVNKGFIRVIDIPYAMEIISERFDNALELIGKNAIVYGGAVRDIVADLPIGGDLDVAVSSHTYNQVIVEFSSSSKWTMVGKGHAILGTNPAIPKPKAKRTGNTPRFTKPRTFGDDTVSSPYGNMPIAETATFETFDTARVQIVKVRESRNGLSPKNASDSVLSLARDADIRCCSLSLNSIGEIFELVDGAYVDCKDKVLRINTIKEPDRFNNLEERIKKLEKRGWSSEISMSKVRTKLKRLQEKEERKTKKSSSKLCTTRLAAEEVMQQTFSIRKRIKGGYTIHIKKELGTIANIDFANVIGTSRYSRSMNIYKLPDGHATSVYLVDSEKDAREIKAYFMDAMRHGTEMARPILQIRPIKKTKAARAVAAEYPPTHVLPNDVETVHNTVDVDTIGELSDKDDDVQFAHAPPELAYPVTNDDETPEVAAESIPNRGAKYRSWVRTSDKHTETQRFKSINVFEKGGIVTKTSKIKNLMAKGEEPYTTKMYELKYEVPIDDPPELPFSKIKHTEMSNSFTEDTSRDVVEHTEKSKTTKYNKKRR